MKRRHARLLIALLVRFGVQPSARLLARAALTCRRCGFVADYRGNPWEQGRRAYIHFETEHDKSGEQTA